MSDQANLVNVLIDALRKEPERFYMPWWMTGQETATLSTLECGTALCIGGWTCLLAGDTVYNAGALSVDKDGNTKDIEERAMDLLGLEDTALFAVGTWPAGLQERYFEAKTKTERVEIGIKAILHFTEGNKNEPV
jgi:hypothetical protein